MENRGLKRLFEISILSILFLTNVSSEEIETTKTPAEAVEEEKDWEIGAEIDFNSQYIWRGMEYSKGAIMNPQAWITWKEWTFYVWSNMVLNDEPTQGDFNEFDYYLTYSKELGKFTLEPSVVYYMYLDQEDSPDTAEASIYLSYDFSPFEIFTRHTVDFVAYDWAYFIENGVTYTQELNDKLSFESTVSVGNGNNRFNKAYVGVNENAWNYIEFDFSFTYNITDNVYVRPHAEYVVILDHDLRNELDNTVFNAGGAIGVTF